jgi:4-carboxymuconolactone decarboxylase
MMSMSSFGATAQPETPFVRMARIVVDPAQLDNYRAALKEEIETAVKVEPGVLSLYAVYEKDNPGHVTIIEKYADEESFKKHLQTPHFKKYKSTTIAMVKSLELLDVQPIALEAKPRR